jgi:membrane-associated phospholipid phosphatase
MSRATWNLGVAFVVLGACSDWSPPVRPDLATPLTPLRNEGAVKPWESNASVHWNGAARSLVAQNRSNPFQAIRGYAIVSVAQYNAAIAAEKAAVDGGSLPSVHAAIASASVVALSYLYPANAAALEADLTQFLANQSWPGDAQRDVDAGAAIGRSVAAQVVAHAQADNFFAPWTGTVPVGPGLWFSNTPPVGAAFGQAKTYFLLSGNQFRPPPPPVFGSAEFLAALAEVRQISDSRTAEQDALAKYWNFPAGTYQPPGYWNEQGTTLAVSYRLNERETAHMLALMNMVAFDAVVASHEAKYFYWFIRPSQADPFITLSVPLPNFPSYPSNHASISAGMARVLGDRFPSEKQRLDALAEEAALSRVLGGIHYRFDGDAGVTLGRKVAAWALAHDVTGHEPFVLQ